MSKKIGEAEDILMAVKSWVENRGGARVTPETTVSSSDGTQGYTKFGSGMVIMWWKKKLSGSAEHTYDLPYLNVFANSFSIVAVSRAREDVGVEALSNNTYYVRQSSSDAYNCNFIAVGMGVGGGGTTSSLVDLVYPVGSIYMSMNNVSPETFIGGTWSLLDGGYWLMSATEGGGSKVDAKLPNIKGTLDTWGALSGGTLVDKSGSTAKTWSANSNSKYATIATFDAHKVNAIYEDGATVQPQSYKVFMWQRTA